MKFTYEPSHFQIFKFTNFQINDMAYKKTEHYDEATTAGLMESYKKVLGLLGEDPKREGLAKNPGTARQGNAIHDTGLSISMPTPFLTPLNSMNRSVK